MMAGQRLTTLVLACCFAFGCSSTDSPERGDNSDESPLSSSGSFSNQTIAGETGAFTLSFDAIPSQTNENAVIGLSSGAASTYTDLAVIVRFNPSGFIDARDGSAYSSTSTITYSAGVTYRFRVVVDVGTHHYSAYVTPAGSAEKTIGTGFAFRTEQGTVSRLDNLGAYAAAGDVSVSLAAAAGFDFKATFDGLPAGPFQLAQQKSIFTDPHIVSQWNGDSAGNMMSIATSGCKSGHCVRYYFPKGTLGSNGCPTCSATGLVGFVLTLTATSILNLEYDWMFEPGFDLYGGVGKIGGWLFFGDSSWRRGTQELALWETGNNAPHFAFVDQDPETGHTCCGTNGVNETITRGQWYHVKLQLTPGSSGHTKAWIDGNLVFTNGPFSVQSPSANTPMADFRSWFGGGGTNNAAKNDSYARIDNIRVWSGSGS